VGTILVVEADVVLRSDWTRSLRERGHAVLEANDLADAVRHAREGGIDAVVLDSIDPARTARALIDELQRLPEPPPLILVSSSPTAPEQSAHLGAAAFVPKPCTGEDLARVAEGLVSARPRSILGDDDDDTERLRRTDL
jgi:two-component system OmpR family response regulator